MGRAARFPYRFLLPLAFLGVLFSFSYGANWDDNSCVGCHTELGDEYVVPVHGWQESTHASAGVACEQCHGGNPSSWDVEEAMSEAKGFVGRPVGAEIVKICGTCHADPVRMRPYGIRTDQLSFYRTSHHGKAVLKRGSTDAATCIDCHGSHRILPPSHPKSLVHHGNVPETCAKCHADEAKMSKYGLPTDALDEYKESYHGVLLYRDDNPLVPNCATCHGTHGATPPGVEDVTQVCGNCHGNTAENYAESPHERARHFYGSPRCVDCHGNHRIRFPSRELFTAEDGCAACHTDDRGAEVARAFYQELDHTASSLEEAKASLEDAPARLIYLDPYRERLREADTRLIEAGPVSHALDLDALKKITSEATAVAEEVHHAIEEKKRELAVRKGAWFVVAFVAVLWVMFLILKLRQIPNPYEGPQSAKDEQ